MARTRTLFPYFVIVFLGYAGFAMPLPILPEMFLDSSRSILPAHFSIQAKTLILGIIIAAYPLGQFFGCPILGILSDKWGRRRIILISLFGNAIGYMITALAASEKSTLGVFLGLLLCGFSEGNIALAQAVIADITEKSQKARQFGWLNFFATMAFILGPLMGGFFADPSHSHLFTFATPFWCAMGITLASIVVVYLMSKETRSKPMRPTGFVQAFRNSWVNREVRSLFAASFLFYLAAYSFWRYFPVFLERRFNFTSSELAYVIAYEALFWALALIWVVKTFSKMQRPVKAVGWFSLGFGVMLGISVLPKSSWNLIWTIPLIGIVQSVVVTMLAVFVSNATDDDAQGQTMGSLQAVQVFAGLVMALCGGVMSAIAPAAPLFVGAAAAVACAWFLKRMEGYV